MSGTLVLALGQRVAEGGADPFRIPTVAEVLHPWCFRFGAPNSTVIDDWRTIAVITKASTSRVDETVNGKVHSRTWRFRDASGLCITRDTSWSL